MTDCDCLTSYEKSLPHYIQCPAAGGGGDNSDIRALAELAAYRDVDTALSCLRSLRRAACWLLNGPGL